jgi:hypothetical protein
MAFTLQNLQSIAECDELVAIVSRERRCLENRKESLEIRNENFQESSSDFEADMAKINSELGYLTSVIPNMPEGEKKEAMITDQLALTVRQRQLNQRRANYGAIGLLQRELDIDLLGRSIIAYNEFIAAVNTHKSTL